MVRMTLLTKEWKDELPGHLESKSTHLGSSPDGEVSHSTPKGVPTAQDYRGVCQYEVAD